MLISVDTSKECLHKPQRNDSERFQEDTTFRTEDMTILANFRKEVETKQTEIHKNCSYLVLVYKRPRNVSRKFKNDKSSRTGVIIISA